MHLSNLTEDPEWGKNRHVALETVSKISEHLMKAFFFSGLHPSILISFKCWNKWVCLVLIVKHSWAEFDTQPKGMSRETQGPSNWKNTKCSFRITTAWQTELTHNSTSLLSEGKSHVSSVLSKNKHLASVIQPHLLYMHVMMTATTQLLSIGSAHIMQQRRSKSSRHGKVLLPLGSDKEGKCFLLSRQVACVKDYTELILHKEKVAFRDCFKTHLFWSFTYILLV